MADSVKEELANTERIRDKVVFCVRRRLDLLAPNPEATRRAAVALALPHNAFLSLRCLHNTVDTIWYAAGDRATDYNYYTKRGLLASVYLSTLLHWLSDTSVEKDSTWAFLGRRIDEVMKIPSSLSALRDRLASLQRPSDFIQKARHASRSTYRF